MSNFVTQAISGFFSQAPSSDVRQPLPAAHPGGIAFYAAAAVVSFLILISRRPDSVLNPQFWAEDGRNWYANAYNLGFLQPLITSEAGYTQTFSRLVALVSQALPLEYAPLFFNLTALLVQVTVALFILSPRLATLFPERRWRIAIAFIYLAMPHSWEVFANVTNSQWHLAFLSLLIIVATPPDRKLWKVLDIIVLVISALSGPFCFLLLPISVLAVVLKKDTRILPAVGILATGCAVQGYFLLTNIRDVQPNLGASLDVLMRLLGRHLFVSPLIGGPGFNRLYENSLWSGAFPYLAVIGGILFFGSAFWKGSTELRLLILFCVMQVAAALYSPAVTSEPGQWGVMAANNTALRYWFIPSMCIYISIVYFLARSASAAARAAAASLVVLTLVGVSYDWKQPRLKDLDFQEHVKRFNAAPAGTEVRIPINPDWQMVLHKH